MNTFSHTKCYNFGKLIPTKWEGTWEELLADGEWVTFNVKHKLTNTQIELVRQGFHGEPMKVIEGERMPFGTHKDVLLVDLPDKYVIWLSKQEWLDKWASVAYHVRTRVNEINRTQLSKDEIKDILKLS